MIVTYEASKDALNDLRGALHQGDHTLRPQVLFKETNPSYYKIISLFEKETGVGGVMNTSFNLHGYPIVNSIEDAIDILIKSNLDGLITEKFLVIKK